VTDLPKYSRMVGFAEIEKNEFNLNLPRYIDSTEPEDLQDIDGHLRGGIPERAAHGDCRNAESKKRRSFV
jgi:type I restriction enzyme M protein